MKNRVLEKPVFLLQMKTAALGFHLIVELFSYL